MKNKYWLWAAISLFSVLNMACGKNESRNTESAGIVGVAASCPAGSTQVNTNGYPMCQGPYGLTTPIYGSVSGTSYSADNYCYKSLKISNVAQYKKFLKEAMGVCDQNSNTGGTASCSYWNSGYLRVNLSAGSGTTGLQFLAYPQSSNYSYSLPKFSDFVAGLIGFPVYNTSPYATRNPLGLSMSTYLINNSQGFEGRQYGDPYTLANRSLIQVQVAKGQPGDAYFTYSMGYEGISFMTGTFVKSDNYSYYCGY